MGEASVTRLAVARLDEQSPAQAHRNREGKPMHGFCLISGGTERCRVTLYVENGRPLADRTGGSGFYYEGWLVGPAGPLSLGAFNMGPGGQGIATRLLETEQLHASRAEVVRVTVEPFGGTSGGNIAVLEGPLVWLESGMARAGLKPAPEDEADTDGAQLTDEMTPLAYSEAKAQIEALAAAQAEAEARAAAQVMAEAEAQEEEEAVTPQGAKAETAADPSGGHTQGSAANLELLIEEPVLVMRAAAPAESRERAASGEQARVPDQAPEREPDPVPEPQPAAAAPPQPTPHHVLSLTVQLVQRHPMAPRAAGTALLNLRQGTLQLMLRGLPSPTALGRDRSTDRPFNSYRVWLVNQQTHARTPVGFCQRAWGENFRFQAEALPLNRHDAILVTVEDRSANGTNTASPQVLMGSYTA